MNDVAIFLYKSLPICQWLPILMQLTNGVALLSGIVSDIIILRNFPPETYIFLKYSIFILLACVEWMMKCKDWRNNTSTFKWTITIPPFPFPLMSQDTNNAEFYEKIKKELQSTRPNHIRGTFISD